MSPPALGRWVRAAVRGSVDCIREPAIAAEVFRKAKRRLSGERRRQAREARPARSWCRARVREPGAALDLGNGASGGLESVAERYPEILHAAERRVAACPMDVGGAANLDLLCNLAEALGARSVVETGVAMGWSTLALLLSLRNRSDGRLFSIDLPYMLQRNDEWVGCAVPESLRSMWTLYRTSDRDGLPQALRQAAPIDLAHYDSDKSYEGRLWGYDRLWSALRPGGVLVSDDVDENLAFHDFCRRLRREPIIVWDETGTKFQGLLVKEGG